MLRSRFDPPVLLTAKQREVDVSLKWVIMRARMLEALQEAYEQPIVDWARIATDLDYSSQAHFINRF